MACRASAGDLALATTSLTSLRVPAFDIPSWPNLRVDADGSTEWKARPADLNLALDATMYVYSALHVNTRLKCFVYTFSANVTHKMCGTKL